MVDARGAHFAVKVVNFEQTDPHVLHGLIEAFLERAQIQKQASAANDSHWARIYHFAKIPDGAFYVTDLFASSLTARWRIRCMSPALSWGTSWGASLAACGNCGLSAAVLMATSNPAMF